jgi:hypothetical protein
MLSLAFSIKPWLMLVQGLLTLGFDSGFAAASIQNHWQLMIKLKVANSESVQFSYIILKARAAGM